MQAAKEAIKQFYPASVSVKQQQTTWQGIHKRVRSGTDKDNGSKYLSSWTSSPFNRRKTIPSTGNLKH